MRKIATALASLSALACSSEEANVPSPPVEVIQLDLSGPRPTAQLSIGDSSPVTAIFDTGAAGSVLRRSYATYLNLRNEGDALASGPGGAPLSGFRTTIERATLGEAHFGPVMAVAFDLPSLVASDVEAVISPIVFSGRLVRFDFSASIAQVLTKTDDHIPLAPATPYSGGNTGGRHTATPTVRVEFPSGTNVTLMADTGSPRGLVLPLSMAQQTPLAAPPTPAGSFRIVGGESPSFSARINGTVRVGPIELQDPEVTFVDAEFPGSVGMAILRGGVLVLDPEERRSWLLAQVEE